MLESIHDMTPNPLIDAQQQYRGEVHTHLMDVLNELLMRISDLETLVQQLKLGNDELEATVRELQREVERM
jgi:molybdenum-dependent DNA-binding transcriptional regulator ModE